MLAINLSEVTEEGYVVRLFPYTFQGSTGSWYFSLPSGTITSWDIFEEQFLTKFGDDCTTATLINDLSNLKENTGEKIKIFNSIFNNLLNKNLTTSKPRVDMQIEWYISSLPSNIAIFVDRANNSTLVENMNEILSVEKIILALEKKTAQEDIKTKKVSFNDESKKKTYKDPYALEGLQKVLKTSQMIWLR